MILATGVTGFVGNALYEKLANHGPLRISVRDRYKFNRFESVDVVEASLSPDQDWRSALSGVSVVVHCAARAHIMKEVAANSVYDFRRVNVDGALNLARQAAKEGVRRFIFMSSIKVNGECTELGAPFTADQIPAPADPYGLSKYEAEIELKILAEETGMEIVIIRSPLVYGPGVKANLLLMMDWLSRGIPLPFGGITKNRRSFIFIDNLVDMIMTCINHPLAANQIFLVSDDEDLSTSVLLERMALALGRPSKLIAVPATLITLGATFFGRADIAQRLCGSLQVDIRKTKDLLGWSPSVDMHEGLRLTAAHYLKMRS